MKRKNAVFAKSVFLFRNGVHINITVTHARGGKSILMPQLKIQQRSFMNSARVPLLTVREKQKDVLEMTDAAASKDMWEEAKRAMEV